MFVNNLNLIICLYKYQYYYFSKYSKTEADKLFFH